MTISSAHLPGHFSIHIKNMHPQILNTSSKLSIVKLCATNLTYRSNRHVKISYASKYQIIHYNARYLNNVI